MRRTWMLTAVAAVALTASPALGSEAQRHADPIGDAVGGAPDIVAVSFSQPDESRVSIGIEFADEPPLETDMDTYTDLVFIHLDSDPDANQVISFDTEDEFDYIIGTHAVQVPIFLETGGMLYQTSGELLEGVIEFGVEDQTLTWTVDRALLGDPVALAWAVLAGVEREDAEEMAYDVSPDEGEAWGRYELTEPTAS